MIAARMSGSRGHGVTPVPDAVPRGVRGLCGVGGLQWLQLGAAGPDPAAPGLHCGGGRRAHCPCHAGRAAAGAPGHGLPDQILRLPAHIARPVGAG